MPPMPTSGMNTEPSDSVIAKMVKLISLAPEKTADQTFSPASMRRTMFSRNTMASSIRKPTERVSAIRERLSSE